MVEFHQPAFARFQRLPQRSTIVGIPPRSIQIEQQIALLKVLDTDLPARMENTALKQQGQLLDHVEQEQPPLVNDQQLAIMLAGETTAQLTHHTLDAGTGTSVEGIAEIEVTTTHHGIDSIPTSG